MIQNVIISSIAAGSAAEAAACKKLQKYAGGPMLSLANNARRLFCGNCFAWHCNATMQYASASHSLTWHSGLQEIFLSIFLIKRNKIYFSCFLAQDLLRRRT